LFLVKLALGIESIVGDIHRVADPGVQVIGQPLVDNDLVVAHVCREQIRESALGVDGRHGRIRGRFVAPANFIDEVRQNPGGTLVSFCRFRTERLVDEIR
jgi:hypothetical protein